LFDISWDKHKNDCYGNSDMNILLIGLHHRHQLEGHPKASKKFKHYLKDLCLSERPDLIAEELNEDAIKKSNARDSVARKIAKFLRIQHLFCDPSIEERKTLGIKCFKEIYEELGYGRTLTREQSNEVSKIEKTYWEKREKFWLERLIEQRVGKCIFLVGADHTDRFASLLSANGVRCIIVETHWEP
jgi:hypothetical protein